MNQHLERLDYLAPFMKAPVHALLERCEAKLKRTLLVVYGWRSKDEQDLIYQRGRTLNRETGLWDITHPDLVVTRAKVSGHNVVTKVGGMAASVCVDVIPLKADGTADWTVDDDFWDALYELSWKVGLDPLGDPVGAQLKGDKGHFEEPSWTLKLDGLGLRFPTTV